MKEQLIQVIGYVYSDEDSETIPVESSCTVNSSDVRFHPVDDAESSDGSTGLSLDELIEEFCAEFNVSIDIGGSGEDEHDFEISDHSFETIEELEECVEALCGKISDWVKGQ